MLRLNGNTHFITIWPMVVRQQDRIFQKVKCSAVYTRTYVRKYSSKSELFSISSPLSIRGLSSPLSIRGGELRTQHSEDPPNSTKSHSTANLWSRQKINISVSKEKKKSSGWPQMSRVWEFCEFPLDFQDSGDVRTWLEAYRAGHYTVTNYIYWVFCPTLNQATLTKYWEGVIS